MGRIDFLLELIRTGTPPPSHRSSRSSLSPHPGEPRSTWIPTARSSRRDLIVEQAWFQLELELHVRKPAEATSPAISRPPTPTMSSGCHLSTLLGATFSRACRRLSKHGAEFRADVTRLR